jgi:hypothetical protein
MVDESYTIYTLCYAQRDFVADHQHGMVALEAPQTGCI